MLDELADFSASARQVAEITRRAMNGEIDFAAALADRVALAGGHRTRVLDEAAARIRLTPGAQALVATMRSAGAATALVSGGFTVFAEPVAAQLGFDRVVANRLEIAEGRLAGHVLPPIVTGDTKRARLAGARRRTRRRGRRRRSLSATAPTTCRCSMPPGSASPFAPSRRLPPRRAGGSTTPT